MTWMGFASIDEIQVEPCLMMEALIGWTQADSFAWDGESTHEVASSNIDMNHAV